MLFENGSSSTPLAMGTLSNANALWNVYAGALLQAESSLAKK